MSRVYVRKGDKISTFDNATFSQKGGAVNIFEQRPYGESRLEWTVTRALNSSQWDEVWLEEASPGLSGS